MWSLGATIAVNFLEVRSSNWAAALNPLSALQSPSTKEPVDAVQRGGPPIQAICLWPKSSKC
jgi:hypothetical protein